MPAGGEQHTLLGRRLEGLYAEQRTERVALWRDISRLRQALPESAEQYLGALRKTDILGDRP